MSSNGELWFRVLRGLSMRFLLLVQVSLMLSACLETKVVRVPTVDAGFDLDAGAE